MFLNSSCLLLGIQLIVGAIASPVKELNVSIDDRSLDTDTTVLVERDMTWDELQGLVTHNGVRKAYKCPPLVWDDSLAEGARQWAQSIATGPFAGKLYEVHSIPNTRPGLGENLDVQMSVPSSYTAIYADPLAELIEMATGWIKSYKLQLGNGEF
ncbi:scp-like extracellular [Fusarium coicis]|nr:scp-like extracellular [Fusarium coicis]